MTQYKILGLFVAAVASLLLADNVAKSQIGQVCSGKLVKEKDGSLTIKLDAEAICVVDPSDTQKILSACAEGHKCEVKGEVVECEESGECLTIKHVKSVKDLTLAYRRK